MHIRPSSCERAAQFASLDLDGELSLFEREMLRRHVGRCASCAEYVRTVTGLTELLRTTPLEQIRLAPIALRPRRLAPRVLSSIAATAAVVAIGTWLGVSFATAPQSREHVPPITTRNTAGVSVSGRGDWAAGLPQTQEVIQLVPGGLRTVGPTP